MPQKLAQCGQLPGRLAFKIEHGHRSNVTGTKRGQQRDIDKAKELLAEYKSRKKAMTTKSSNQHKG